MTIGRISVIGGGDISPVLRPEPQHTPPGTSALASEIRQPSVVKWKSKRMRRAAWERQSRFEVREIDVTFRPEIVRAKGLRSVPVLEANGQLLVGNATSAQIAAFLETAGKAGDPRAAPDADWRHHEPARVNRDRCCLTREKV